MCTAGSMGILGLECVVCGVEVVVPVILSYLLRSCLILSYLHCYLI